MLDLDTLKTHQCLNLTTTGHRSGQERTVELWFVVYQEQLYVMAEHDYDTGWVENLQKLSAASVNLAGNTVLVQARILTSEQDGTEWRAVAEQFQTKYG